MPSAKTALFTPRSTTGPSPRSLPPRDHPSAGVTLLGWRVSPPASMVSPRQACPTCASCSTSDFSRGNQPPARTPARSPFGWIALERTEEVEPRMGTDLHESEERSSVSSSARAFLFLSHPCKSVFIRGWIPFEASKRSSCPATSADRFTIASECSPPKSPSRQTLPWGKIPILPLSSTALSTAFSIRVANTGATCRRTLESGWLWRRSPAGTDARGMPGPAYAPWGTSEYASAPATRRGLPPSACSPAPASEPRHWSVRS